MSVRVHDNPRGVAWRRFAAGTFVFVLGAAIGILAVSVGALLLVLFGAHRQLAVVTSYGPLSFLLRADLLVTPFVGLKRFRAVFDARLSFLPVTWMLVLRAIIAGIFACAFYGFALAAIWALLAAFFPHAPFLVALGHFAIASPVVESWQQNLFRYDRVGAARGTPVLSLKEARRFFQCWRLGRSPIPFSGILFRSSKVVHALWVGVPNTGKTLFLRMALAASITSSRWILRRRRLARKAVYYDPSQRGGPILRGMGVKPRQLRNLNPLAEDGLYIDFARDFDTPELAKQLAALLLPHRPKEQEPFWNESARAIVEELVLLFQRNAPGAWTFRQLYSFASAEPAHIIHALSLTDSGRAAVGKYLGEPRLAHSVASTTDARMRTYSSIAFAGDRCADGLSMRQWLSAKRPSVLVLGTDPQRSEALKMLNRVILARLFQLVLSGPPDPPRRKHLIFAFDEVTDLGNVPGIGEFARKVRQKGGRILATTQSREALQEEYGRSGADDLLGLFSSIGFTSAPSIGTRELVTRLVGTTQGGSAAFLDSELNAFWLPSPRRGIDVLAKGPDTPFWKGTVKRRFTRKYLRRESRRAAGSQDPPAGRTAPMSLTELDYAALGIPYPPPDTTEQALALLAGGGPRVQEQPEREDHQDEVFVAHTPHNEDGPPSFSFRPLRNPR